MRYIFVIASILTIIILAAYPPPGVDWETVFARADISNPYATSSYISPPWTLLFLPHRLLPLRWSNAVNAFLNIAVLLLAIWKLRGGWRAMALVFTSPVFFNLMWTNNIDWLPLLGLLVGPGIGSVLLSCKPHTLGAVMLIWAKQDWRILILPAILALASFALWGWWPAHLGNGAIGKSFNTAAWPIGIPFGLWLLRLAWRRDDEYLAAVSTALLTPYIAPYSLTSVLAVLACKRRAAGLWLWFALWAFTIIEYRRIYG